MNFAYQIKVLLLILQMVNKIYIQGLNYILMKLIPDLLLHNGKTTMTLMIKCLIISRFLNYS